MADLTHNHYVISEASTHEELPYHLLLLGDENQQLIDRYLPVSRVFLLKIDGNSVGICLLQRSEHASEIMNVAVEPAHQGKGLGRALLTYVIDVARQQGESRLMIKTGNSGIGQLALYQQLGFDLVDVNYNYFPDNYPEPIWENGIQCKHQLVFALRL